MNTVLGPTEFLNENWPAGREDFRTPFFWKNRFFKQNKAHKPRFKYVEPEFVGVLEWILESANQSQGVAQLFVGGPLMNPWISEPKSSCGPGRHEPDEKS